MTEPCIYTLDQLQERLAFWQQRLSLQDWTIDLSIRRMSAFERRDSAGELHTYERRKSALIFVLDPADYTNLNPPAQWPQDMEYTLVHELMHLSIYPCTIPFSDTNQRIELIEEQVVHALACAFLSFWRPALPQAMPLGALPAGPPGLPLDLMQPMVQQRPQLAVSNPSPPVATAEELADAFESGPMLPPP